MGEMSSKSNNLSSPSTERDQVGKAAHCACSAALEVQQDEFYSNCHILGPMAIIGSEGDGEIFSHDRAC